MEDVAQPELWNAAFFDSGSGIFVDIGLEQELRLEICGGISATEICRGVVMTHRLRDGNGLLVRGIRGIHGRGGTTPCLVFFPIFSSLG